MARCNSSHPTGSKRKAAQGFAAVALSAALVATPVSQALGLNRTQVLAGKASAENDQQLAGSVQAAKAAGIAGSGVLERYVAGQAVTDAEFLSIDAASLAKIDASLAQEISAYQVKLKAAQLPSTPTQPTEPQQPATPTQPSQPGAGDSGQQPEAPGTGETPAQPGEQPGGGEAAGDSGASGDAGAGSGDAGNQGGQGTDPSKPSNPDESADGTGSAGSDEGSQPSSGNEGSNAAASDASQNAVSAKEALDALANQSNAANMSNANTLTNNQNLVKRHISANLTTQKFIAVIGEQAREVAQENNLYASVMIAQAILESASGNSSLAQNPNNNLFGIKGSHNGKSVVMRTGEDDGTGTQYFISASFRAYDNVRQSLDDYASLLSDSMDGFYAGTWKSNAATYADACDYLQGRYATDTSYSAKLQALIEAYDLTRYDQPLAYETVNSYELPAVDEETGNAVVDESGNAVMEQRTLADLETELTSHLGETYVYGGATCGAFDCSGLVQYCYKKALGIDLPRTAESQSQMGSAVSMITEEELLKAAGIDPTASEEAAAAAKAQLVSVNFDALHAGDLVFFANGEHGEVGHVGVYLGEGCYIQAPKTGDVVKVTSLAEREPTFAMRVVPVKEANAPAAEAEAAPAGQADQPAPAVPAVEVQQAVSKATLEVSTAAYKVGEEVTQPAYFEAAGFANALQQFVSSAKN